MAQFRLAARLHLALMEDEFVRKRHWITEADFLDLLGAVLDGVVVGPLALMIVVAWQPGRAAVVD